MSVGCADTQILVEPTSPWEPPRLIRFNESYILRIKEYIIWLSSFDRIILNIVNILVSILGINYFNKSHEKTYIKSTITLAGRINTANKAIIGTIFSANSSLLISVTCIQFYTSHFVWSQTNNQSNRRYSINTSNND